MKILKSEIDKLNIPREVIPPVDTLIMLGYRGSIAHGTYIPNNDQTDIDLMGVYIDNIEYYYGLIDNEKKDYLEEKKDEWDAVSYEIRKLFNLLLKQNPNVLMLLFLEEKHIIYKTDIWQMIIDNKECFNSKNAFHSFAGYVNGQLRRKTHRSASHAIKLLYMCIEYLETGYMSVDRTKIDAELIIDIKMGKLKLEAVKVLAEKLFKQARLAYEKSSLPEEVDEIKVEVLLVEILRNYFKT